MGATLPVATESRSMPMVNCSADEAENAVNVLPSRPLDSVLQIHPPASTSAMARLEPRIRAMLSICKPTGLGEAPQCSLGLVVLPSRSDSPASALGTTPVATLPSSDDHGTYIGTALSVLSGKPPRCSLRLQVIQLPRELVTHYTSDGAEKALEGEPWPYSAPLPSSSSPRSPAAALLAAFDHAEPLGGINRLIRTSTDSAATSISKPVAASGPIIFKTALPGKSGKGARNRKSRATKEQLLAWAKATSGNQSETGHKATREQVLAWAKTTSGNNGEVTRKATREQVLEWSRATSGNGETSRIRAPASPPSKNKRESKRLGSPVGKLRVNKLMASKAPARPATERAKRRPSAMLAQDVAVATGSGELSPPLSPLLERKLPTARTVARSKAKRLMMMSPVLAPHLHSTGKLVLPPRALSMNVNSGGECSATSLKSDKFPRSPNLTDPALAAGYQKLSHPAVGKWLQAQREAFLTVAASAPLHSARL